jgi:hypothetical protein
MKDRAADWSGVSPAVGFWSAWMVALNFCYVAAAVAAGAAQGVPRDCLLGLSGPITGVMALRLIGVAGYGVLFPVVCVLISLVFKQSQRDRVPEELPAAVS